MPGGGTPIEADEGQPAPPLKALPLPRPGRRSRGAGQGRKRDRSTTSSGPEASRTPLAWRGSSLASRKRSHPRPRA
eukprot:5732988-Alexandrium_andersonii.AAC.1